MRNGYTVTYQMRKRQRQRRQKIIGYVLKIAAAVLIAFLIVRFVCFSYTIQGDSMMPTIENGEKHLVNRLIYELKTPDYGDLIVFKPNGNQNAHYHIKRVAGKPGDTVTIESGRVFINGEVLDEKVQTESMADAGLAEEGITLGEDEFFVLGDNRNNSEDSRSADIGNVKREDILGKAWFIIAPGERFGFLR